MIKEIKTEKFEGLSVLVPARYVSAFANMGYLVVKVDNPATFIGEDEMFPPGRLDKALARVSKLPEHITLPAIKLPDGEFKILERADKLTEEQCAEIIISDEWPMTVRETIYWPDFNYIDEQVVESAKESFETFMESIGAYSVNPFGEKPTETFNHPDWEFTRSKWQEAEASTGLWLILKKI